MLALLGSAATDSSYIYGPRLYNHAPTRMTLSDIEGRVFFFESGMHGANTSQCAMPLSRQLLFLSIGYAKAGKLCVDTFFFARKNLLEFAY